MIEITFTGKFTLNELLLFRTIPELKELALNLGIRIKGSPKKQVIVDNLEKYMLENPGKVVSNMFYYELKACLDVIEGNATLDYIEKSGLLFQLNRFGLIYSLVDNKTEVTSLHFEEAMADKLRGLIPDEITRREKDGSLMAEKLAIGCANLYGFTETGYLIDLVPELENHLGHTLDEKSIIHLFKPVLRAMRHGIKGKERPFISPFAAYNGFEVDERHIDFMIEPKVFDTATILDYGEMPYPNIKGKAADRLLDTLKKFGKPDVTPEYVIRDLWIDKQSISEIGIPDISKYFSFKSLDNARLCIDPVIDFLNNTPLWRFNGNSSSEVASMSKPMAKGKMPGIIMGPGMRALGIDSVEQLEEMASHSGFSLLPGKPYKAEPKVGRNDPCPCGSGKKYKHCCGKN